MVVWGPFLTLAGFLLLRPPFSLSACLGRLRLGRVVASVLRPCFVALFPFGLCPFGFAMLSVWGFRWCALWCSSLCVVLPCVVGPLCLCLVCLAFVGSPPACICFPSPRGWSCVVPWPSLYAGPSLWVSGCICDGLVALLLAGSVAVLCCPHFTLPHGSKGLWPCVGCVAPSPPCCKCC